MPHLATVHIACRCATCARWCTAGCASTVFACTTAPPGARSQCARAWPPLKRACRKRRSTTTGQCEDKDRSPLSSLIESFLSSKRHFNFSTETIDRRSLNYSSDFLLGITFVLHCSISANLLFACARTPHKAGTGWCATRTCARIRCWKRSSCGRGLAGRCRLLRPPG